MNVKWCVCSGPDESHLLSSSWFVTLKEAKEYSENLTETPMGKPRPYRILRYEFDSKFLPPTGYKEIESNLNR
jgi:hypothetical protein